MTSGRVADRARCRAQVASALGVAGDLCDLNEGALTGRLLPTTIQAFRLDQGQAAGLP
jgi:hypothetical protein